MMTNLKSVFKGACVRLWRLILAGMDVYALLLGFYFVARVVVGREWWYTNLVGNFLGWLLLLSFGMLPLVLVARHRWRIAYTFSFMVLFGVLFGELYIPRASSDHESSQFRVMSYNVAMYRMPPAWMLEALQDSEADIIALTELGVDQQTMIESELAEEYPYQVLNGVNSVTGSGLLSRFPIVASEWVSTQANSPYLKATLEIEGQAIEVLVAHPPAPSLGRNLTQYGDNPVLAEDLALALRLLDTQKPTLLLGDFNITDQSPYYDRIIAAGFSDAFRAKGFGLGATFPSQLPLVRIDYIFVSPHFAPLSAAVGADHGSDHRAIWADIARVD